MYTYSFVNSFYKMGLFTKDDVKLLLEVKQFSQDDYYKMFPEDKPAETTASTQTTVAPTA